MYANIYLQRKHLPATFPLITVLTHLFLAQFWKNPQLSRFALTVLARVFKKNIPLL